jgi:predicted nucleotidyltransferase|tara:strand:- start:726 stop:1112 length:387 start_codon:yes stop_codon:yes gene_type:complete
MLSQSYINKVKQYAVKTPRIVAIYLYGSYAKGKTKKNSDVDLGILFSKETDGFKRIEMETDLSNLLKKDVDLVDMKKASPLLRHQIYKYGAEIYSKESDYPACFRASSMQEYLDTLYLQEQRMKILYG